jgi:glucose-6-phosphate isomerase
MTESTNEAARLINLLRKSNTQNVSLAQRLAEEPDRFDRFSCEVEGLVADFSRVNLSDADFSMLLELAECCGVAVERERMFSGERINLTEDRPVLHPLWRSHRFSDLLPPAEAADLSAAVRRMNDIAAALHEGRLPGNGPGSRIRHLIHIGIGGSLLGPRLLCEAFPPNGDSPEIHFLSSVDALERERLLARLDPGETAVMLVSKSFTTSEVLLHARRIRDWQRGILEPVEADRRLFAVTAAPEKAEAFGVPAPHVLQMGHWTGGRYSVWSPVGVTAAVAMGPKGFSEFLAGGAYMDRHFREADPSANLPIIFGLLAVWHRNVCGYPVHGLVPYDRRLQSLPSWLQQVEMESNGKSVDLSGDPVAVETAPVVMGESGTDAQHSLFQAFHQGTSVVPLDFIGVIQPDHSDIEAQQQLLAHMLAQSTALAVGRDLERVREAMIGQGAEPADTEELAPHRVMPGNRPSIVLLLDRLTPGNLGKLLVLYEHMVLVESVVWHINAFDQWGVELGKILAGAIQPAVAGEVTDLPADIPGLAGLVGRIRRVTGGREA